MSNVLQASYKVNKNLQRYGNNPLAYTQILQPDQNTLMCKYRNQTKTNVQRSTSPGLVRRMIQSVTPIAGGNRGRNESRRTQQKMMTRKRSRRS